MVVFHSLPFLASLIPAIAARVCARRFSRARTKISQIKHILISTTHDDDGLTIAILVAGRNREEFEFCMGAKRCSSPLGLMDKASDF